MINFKYLAGKIICKQLKIKESLIANVCGEEKKCATDRVRMQEEVSYFPEPPVRWV